MLDTNRLLVDAIDKSLESRGAKNAKNPHIPMLFTQHCDPIDWGRSAKEGRVVCIYS